MNKKPENKSESTSDDSDEDRCASPGPFLNESKQGTAEGKEIGAQLEDTSIATQEVPPLAPVQTTELAGLQSMSDCSVTVIYKEDRPTFTEDEMALIRLGIRLNDGNDQWTMVYVPRNLYIHHALTGQCLYKVYFHPSRMGWAVGKIKFNCLVKGDFSQSQPITLIKKYLARQ